MTGPFPPLSSNAMTVLERRYLMKGENEEIIETPEGMFRRVAKKIAEVNARYGDRSVSDEEKEFYEAMSGLKFLPNSPTLMNAGTSIGQLSACYVIPVGDSIESIYGAVRDAAIIHQSGGGTGFSFSSLRPQGDKVRSTGGIASGPISFMKVFDAATEAVKQGGRRRGANMGVLRMDHPDIDKFISAKEDRLSLSNFNISVGVTDEFMQKAERNEFYDLINPRSGQAVGRANASIILDRIAMTAWRTGDPGVIFLDTINSTNPTPGLGKMEATNPCGEVPLLPYEACNLGSIDLNTVLFDDGAKVGIDREELSRLVDLGIRFLDNVIDANVYPLEATKRMVLGNRKIGLGIMGFADILLKLGEPYGSEGSLRIAEEIILLIRDSAMETSANIAESRGDFPNIKKSVYSRHMRNATVLSIAPTGTISIIAGCSSGIEPLYAISFAKNILGGERLKEIHPYFLQVANERGFLNDDLMKEVAAQQSIQNIGSIPEDVRRLFVTAHDIDPRDQIVMQAIFQKHVDNAVSKTINLAAGATWRQVRDAYVLAHRSGCKGITVYREGSKPGQVLTLGATVNCPTCGQELKIEEGAFLCENCG